MNENHRERSPRTYPHSSGDRNTMPSADIHDAPTRRGGVQRDPKPKPPKRKR